MGRKNNTGMTHIDNLTDEKVDVGDWLSIGARSTAWLIVMQASKRRELDALVAEGKLRVVYPGGDLPEGA